MYGDVLLIHTVQRQLLRSQNNLDKNRESLQNMTTIDSVRSSILKVGTIRVNTDEIYTPMLVIWQGLNIQLPAFILAYCRRCRTDDI